VPLQVCIQRQQLHAALTQACQWNSLFMASTDTARHVGLKGLPPLIHGDDRAVCPSVGAGHANRTRVLLKCFFFCCYEGKSVEVVRVKQQALWQGFKVPKVTWQQLAEGVQVSKCRDLVKLKQSRLWHSCVLRLAVCERAAIAHLAA
jgi:hypothetical protein